MALHRLAGHLVLMYRYERPAALLGGLANRPALALHAEAGSALLLGGDSGVPNRSHTC